MSDYFPIIAGLGVAVYGFMATIPKGRRLATLKRSFAGSPLVNLAALLLALGLLYAATIGSHQLAAYLYDTASPARDEIRTARVLLLSPIWLPVLILVVWAVWSERRGDKARTRRTLHEPKFADPAKEYRVQAPENER